MAADPIPMYLGGDFTTAAPGHRFSLYLPAVRPDAKLGALKKVVELNDSDRSTLRAMIARQARLAAELEESDQLQTFSAISTAPFVTGLGNEHPLENGFSFLSPYGLPYLPGSGVKAVLRRAAQELIAGVFGYAQGWTPEALQALFGVEDGEGDPCRGLLSFWDVIPEIKTGMKIEIMTPHQSGYYQNGESPHDNGSPNPILFLSVPPGSAFAFHVQANRTRMARFAPALLENNRWRALMHVAFMHAFDWLGFGAKTAVGYGAMRFDEAAGERREQDRKNRAEQERKRQAQAERERKLAVLSPLERKIEEIMAAKHVEQPDESALFNAIREGRFELTEREEAAHILKARMQSAKLWKESTSAKKPEKDKDYQRTLEVMKWLES